MATKAWETSFQEFILQPPLYSCSHILLLQPHHYFCSHILAPAATFFCSYSYIFAFAVTSLLLKKLLGSCRSSHKSALAATYWLLQLHICSFRHYFCSCIYIFAYAVTSQLLKPPLGSCSHILAPEAGFISLLYILLAPGSNTYILKHTPCFWSSYALPTNRYILDWSGSEFARPLLTLLVTFLEPVTNSKPEFMLIWITVIVLSGIFISRNVAIYLYDLYNELQRQRGDSQPFLTKNNVVWNQYNFLLKYIL